MTENLALFAQIVGALVVFGLTIGRSNLQALRITYAMLAIVAAISLIQVLGVAREDPEILIPAGMRFTHFLAIPAFLALWIQSPGRKALTFALVVAALSLATDVLGVGAAVLFGSLIAESGRQDRGVSPLVLIAIAANIAVSIRALLAARGALSDFNSVGDNSSAV